MLLTFIVCIYIECTKATLSTFVIFRLVNFRKSLGLSEKIICWVFAQFKSIKLLLFLLQFFIIKARKFWKSFFVLRFIFKTTKIWKVKWLFTTLFLCNINLAIFRFNLITKLRKMNWFLILDLRHYFCWSSFFLNIWIEWLSCCRKGWCFHWNSLLTWNILKLFKIKTLIRFFVLNWKFPALIHLISLFGFINLRFILSHSFKRILDWYFFCLFLRYDDFLKRSLLTDRI